MAKKSKKIIISNVVYNTITSAKVGIESVLHSNPNLKPKITLKLHYRA
jgi:hypothetical protein